MQTTSSPTRRRRSAFIAVFAAALLALGALALSPAVAHAAPKATKGAEIHTLKENQTYAKYDITGDGRPDSIMVESYYDYYGQSSRFYVNINDSYWAFDTYHYGVTARLVKLANGTPYLFLRAWADNDDAEVCGLYQNKGNRLKRVVDCNKGFGTKIGFHPGGDIKKVSGNSITFSFTQMAYFSPARTSGNSSLMYQGMPPFKGLFLAG